ncbi:hypothetical protein, partial [Klebsiella pneumoniae]|uniref:hypothetical protein n=1 Tax=Klebsiella pneumoniae TaxID=573 RepID=UPI003F8617FF
MARSRHNVQVLPSDRGKRSGTGSALKVPKDSGGNTYPWQGGPTTKAHIMRETGKGGLYSPAGNVCASDGHERAG